MVRELLTASGSTFANPPANYYRALRQRSAGRRDPQSLAETTAQLFFGIRMQCAKCHNHPFERWTQDDYYSMAAFFARVKAKADPLQPGSAPQPYPWQLREDAIVIYSARAGEVTQPRTGKVMAPKVMGVPAPVIPPGKDRREVLADLVTAADNPFFARAVVNRIWFHLIGKGIVDPVDDFRDSNPSANDELLDALAKDFVDHKFDVKHMIRTIVNSRTYQLSAQANDDQQGRQQVFLARLSSEAADGGSAARRHLCRDRRCRRSSPACRRARGPCSCPTARSFTRAADMPPGTAIRS